MRGHVRKRGKGWAVVVDTGRDVDGKRHQKWHSGFRTKKEAEEALTDILSRIHAGTYVAPSHLTVATFVNQEWLPSLEAAVAGGNLRPSTAAQRRILVSRHVVPRIGHLHLRSLTAPALNDLYAELLKTGKNAPVGEDAGPTLSTTTVRAVHSVVHKMLADAEKWGRVAQNVAAKASPPRPRKVEMKTWGREELARFAEVTAGTQFGALWRLLAATGMRRGEACGLRWEDVDFESGTVTIRSARVVVDHTVIESRPKTATSFRTVALDDGTVDALRAHRTRQVDQKREWGDAYTDSGLVVTWEDGRPVHPNIVSKTFTRTLDDAGLPPIRLHDLRHSHATAGLEAGVPAKVMSERLGHSSVKITLDTYSHVRPAFDREAARKTAAHLFGEG